MQLLEPWLLLLLRVEPDYGYELRLRLAENGIAADQSGVYRTLRDLEARRVVTSEWGESSEGPPRRVYKLSSKGRRHLDRYAGEFEDARATFSAFLEQYDAAKRRRR